ncbi:hypothetical protein FisN_6Lh265 [Fistulifera solaris]|uniref:Mif2/CENP-C cupin domain-containing protein n=1 Tax=Fistulifera solaris TaxID=1519565 RepID=A0A1Z5J5V0_FISSO|nr:hypothetical protein FisN_6Lh265 [Fistulifera solaris]|eukprot:GAX09364.1 hypothetical protein FisN_6Lh265 [Fistulifera solaris]
MATAAGKQRSLRGKRTGIQIPESNNDDLDNVFAGATSPPATQDGEADSVQYTVERSTRKKKQLRFSLGPDDSSKNSTENGGDVTRLVSGLQRATRQSLSPSELSKVSTAPPSLDRSTVAQFDDEEIGRNLQEHGGEDDFSPLLKAKIGEEIADLPITQDDMDDDMIPPAPDDNSDTEDENPDFLSPKTPALSPAPVDKTPGQLPATTPALDDTDDEDDGVGFQIGDDDHQTPMLSSREVSEEKKKKRKKKHKSTSDDTTDVNEFQRKQKKKLKNRTFSPKGMQSGPLTYKHVVPVTDPKDEPAEGLRRSKRMRIAPLAFWKNEGADYVPNDFDDDLIDGLETMPVVKAYRIAEKTPYKKRKVPDLNHQEQNTKTKKSVSSKASIPAEAEFDSSKLKKKYKYIDSDTAYVWDDCYERADDLAVVGYKDRMVARKLPMQRRHKSDGKVVGVASQAFNVSTDSNPVYPSYIMGNLTLPPGGIKDPESVGACAQTFTVVTGQKNALEISYGDPDVNEGEWEHESASRFLLNPGDIFRVPPGNCYRIQNHSKDTESFLTWTIIRSNYHIADGGSVNSR